MAAVCAEQVSPSVQHFRVEGALDRRGLFALVQEYGPQIREHAVWDFNGAGLAGLTADDMWELTTAVRKALAGRVAGSGTAFVGGSDFVFGMARMYSTIADIEELPYRYRVCRTTEEALAWLAGLVGRERDDYREAV